MAKKPKSRPIRRVNSSRSPKRKNSKKPTKKRKPKPSKPVKRRKPKPSKPVKRRKPKPSKPIKRRVPSKSKRPKKPRPVKGERRTPALPPGLRETFGERALKEMRLALETVKSRIPYDSAVRIFEHSDSSIDGECRIELPRDVSTYDAIREIGFEAQEKPFPMGWASGCLIRSAGRHPETITGLIRVKGKQESRVCTYWRRGARAKIGIIFISLREIDRNFREKNRPRANTCLFKLHWNPMGERPGENR